MMHCPHCVALRAATTAFLAECGCSSWIEWSAAPSERPKPWRWVLTGTGWRQLPWHKPPPWQKVPPSWTFPNDGTLTDCRCDCHSFARIAGRLPRLEEAS